jgi:hypothetical protein
MKLYMQKPSGSKILMRISWGGHGEVLSLSLSLSLSHCMSLSHSLTVHVLLRYPMVA